MKKFTKIDEELLKESESAQNMFNMRFEEFKQKMDNINIAINNLKDEYQSNLRNWGYVGSMGYVNETLDNILEHLEKYIKK
jgi:uncharacterized coiled-coil DUF342 family protein